MALKSSTPGCIRRPNKLPKPRCKKMLMGWACRVMDELRARDMDHVLIFGGGVIPDADAAALKQQGVSEIFGPCSSLKTIAEWLEVALDNREKVTT